MKNAIVVVVIDNYPHARRTPTRASEGGDCLFVGPPWALGMSPSVQPGHAAGSPRPPVRRPPGDGS